MSIKLFFRKATAILSLFALLAVNVPPNLTVPEYIASLASVETANAGDEQACAPNSFTVNVENNNASFVIDHNENDNGACDDLEWRVFAVKDEVETLVKVHQGQSNVLEQFDTTLNLPDGIYTFRLKTGVFTKANSGGFTINNVCDASDITDFAHEEGANPVVGEIEFTWGAHAICDGNNVLHIDFLYAGTATVARTVEAGQASSESFVFDPAAAPIFLDGTYDIRLRLGQSIVSTINNVELDNFVGNEPGVCEASEAGNFELDTNQNYAQPILNFTWSHLDDSDDLGDCNDKIFRIEYRRQGDVQWISNLYDEDAKENGIEAFSVSRNAQTGGSERFVEGETYSFRLYVYGGAQDDRLLATINGVLIDKTSPTVENAIMFDNFIGAAEEEEDGHDGYLDVVLISFTDNDAGMMEHDNAHLDIEDLDLSIEGYTITRAFFPEDGGDELVLFIEADGEAPTPDTGAELDISYSGDGLIYDLAGNQLEADTQFDVDDQAAPVLMEAYTRDLNKNGTVDAFKLIFSEVVDDDSIAADAEGMLNIVDEYTFNPTERCEPNSEVDRVENSNYICLQFDEEELIDELEDDIFEKSDFESELSLFDGEGRLLEDLAGNPNVAQEEFLVVDGAGPIVLYVYTRDLDEDGILDAVRVQFSEDIDDGSLNAGGFVFSEDYAEHEPFGFNAEDSCDGADERQEDSNYACFTFDRNAELDDLEGDTGVTPIVLIDLAGLVRDLDGNINPGHDQVHPTIDEARPVLLGSFTRDVNKDAAVDAVHLYFSEEVDSNSINLEEVEVSLGEDADFVLNFEETDTCIASDEEARDAGSYANICIGVADGDEGEIPVDDTAVVFDVSFTDDFATDLADDANDVIAVEEPIETDDGAAPLILSVETRDLNYEEGQRFGLIDAVKITLSEDIDDTSFVPNNIFNITGFVQPIEAAFTVTNTCEPGDQNRANDSDYVCILVNESETAFSSNFTGNTDATPIVTYVRGNEEFQLEDLVGNVPPDHTNLGTEDGSALDGAGPVITWAQTVSNTAGTLRAYFSEALDDETVDEEEFVVLDFVEGDLEAIDLDDVTYVAEAKTALLTLADAYGSNDTFFVEFDAETVVTDVEENPPHEDSIVEVQVVDVINPVLTAVTLSAESTSVTTNGVITLTVLADEDDYCEEEVTCIVTVNTVNVTDSMEIEQLENGFAYTFTYTVLAGHTARSSGQIPVSITFKDPSTNSTVTTTKTVADNLSISFSSPKSSSGSSGGGGSTNTQNTLDTSTESTETTTTVSAETSTQELTVYQQEVANVMTKGIVTQDPTNGTNKCEALMMMSRAFNWDVPTVTESPFTDVPEWCVSVAAFGSERGTVEGRTATTLGMETPVTRFEVAVMLYRELLTQEYEFTGTIEKEFTDAILEWAQTAVTTLVKESIIKGFDDGTFGGSLGILKQDLGVMLLRVTTK